MPEILMSEIIVEVRRSAPPVASDGLGQVAATILEVRPCEVLSKTSERCEECPDAVENPPEFSECPYFEPMPDGRPVCTRDAHDDDEINRAFFGA